MTKYQPLIVILAIITILSVVLSYGNPTLGFMQAFMGFFFVIFAMFKLFNVKGFVKGFAMYDLVTKYFKPYAYAYPFIELGLGILYLSNSEMFITSLLTAIVMFVSATGVIVSIRRGMNVKCACLGTTLEVPLSTVSILENVGMGLMAVLMLLTMSS